MVLFYDGTKFDDHTRGAIGSVRLKHKHKHKLLKKKMKRSAIAFTLVAFLCSGSLAQAQKKGERREYGRGKLTVKDPADFRTEVCPSEISVTIPEHWPFGMHLQRLRIRFRPTRGIPPFSVPSAIQSSATGR